MMADRYQAFVSGGVGKKLATQLGLPRPAMLRRYDASAPLLAGPVLVTAIGTSTIGSALLDVAAAAGAQTQTADDEQTRYVAVLIDASGVSTIAELAGLRDAFTGVLRRMKSSGRVVVFAAAPTVDDAVELAATRQALDGFIRSLAKELRAGGTANLIYLDSPDPSPVALESTLRFFLSGRSAYVDGQVVHLGAGAVDAPSDWSRPLHGKVALVTGAARGIGAAIATTLARDGATVVCADLPAAGEALARVANAVNGTTLQLDIAAPDAPARIAEHLQQRHGGVDIVVHNAGITRDKSLANMKAEVWSSVLDVNLVAQLRIDDALVQGKILHDGGRIVCLSSTSGIAGNRGQTNYAASKAGIIGMVRATAPRLTGGSTINAVAPGFIDTAMTHRMPLATREIARRLNSLQQAGLPIDVAETVAWLASPGAGAVTGQVVRVCGQNLVGA
jgi:3-oxoacyl-[acyl-carrier protein] reductase